MAGGQERVLRARIKSVQSIRKITRAMELIAATRVVKAQDRASAARPYSDEITAVIIDLLRADLGVAYPLAHHRPFVSGRNLVMQAQDQAGLDPDFCLVAVANGQLILTGPSQLFVDRVTWVGDIAAGWRPHDDPSSPVRMTPDVRFGKPAIGGISTDILWEHDQAGEAVDEIASDFDLTPDNVRWALAYENSVRATPAA